MGRAETLQHRRESPHSRWNRDFARRLSSLPFEVSTMNKKLKKSTKKLQLSRESLRTLSAHTLDGVAGGTGIPHTKLCTGLCSAFGSCQTCKSCGCY
jgi:hypothetical protein